MIFNSVYKLKLKLLFLKLCMKLQQVYKWAATLLWPQTRTENLCNKDFPDILPLISSFFLLLYVYQLQRNFQICVWVLLVLLKGLSVTRATWCRHWIYWTQTFKQRNNKERAQFSNTRCFTKIDSLRMSWQRFWQRRFVTARRQQRHKGHAQRKGECKLSLGSLWPDGGGRFVP